MEPPDPQRFWTRRQADEVLEPIAEVVDILRTHLAEREAATQELEDLRIVYEGAAEREGHVEHEAYRLAARRFQAAQNQIIRVANEFFVQGITFPDPVGGTVDFLSLRGTTTGVLCWRLGEPRVGKWHDLGEECDKRRSIPEAI